MDQTGTRALAPYRALDLTGALGALGGQVLAGLGADVIKIEWPGGDQARARGPFFRREGVDTPPGKAGAPSVPRPGAPHDGGCAAGTPVGEALHPHRSLSWLFANAGKRGITLDLTRAEGQELLRRLAAAADFLLESYPPGYLESLGLGYDDLAAVNPALVMVRVSPFGQSGPCRDYQATDIIAWAMGGQMALDGDADRPPVRVSAPQTELLAGAHAAAAAMTAHYYRQRTGLGQQVDVAAQECVTWTLMIAAQTWDIAGINPRRGGAVRRTVRAGGDVLEHRVIWPCKDGFVLWALGGGGQAGALTSTRALVAWMAEEGEAGAAAEVDWSRLSAAAIDQETYDRLAAPFLAFFAARSKRELFAGALARSIQLAPVNELPDVAASPQLAARDYWTDIAHPCLDATLRFPGAPVKLSATPWRLTRPAPLPGEHNAEVYGGLLGLRAAELDALRVKGVIGPSPPTPFAPGKGEAVNGLRERMERIHALPSVSIEGGEEGERRRSAPHAGSGAGRLAGRIGSRPGEPYPAASRFALPSPSLQKLSAPETPVGEGSVLPFAGIKVVDFSWVGVGPIVARHLADFGATVVRVESATRPDTLRLAPPFRDGQPGINRSAFGAVYNTNKLGLALNLRLSRAREVALRLVRWADIVTDSMTPGSLDRLGLGYQDLRTIKPAIIMYSTTQQGQTGPYRSFGGYGQHGAAMAGFHALTGWPDRPPAGIFGAYTDFVAPWFLFSALVAALDYRDRTGQGQHLDQSQVESALQLLGPQLLDYFATGRAASRAGNDDPEMFPHGAFPVRDAERGAGSDEPGIEPGRASIPHSGDRWVAIAVRDDADWTALSRVIGREAWGSDPAYCGSEARRSHGAGIRAAITAWTRERTPHEAMAALQQAGVPAGAVQTCEELFADPQLAHRGHWWRFEHAVIGLHAYDAPAWKLARTPAQGRSAGPALGQHSFEVCRDILGMGEEAIAELSAEGVFE